MKVKKMNTYRTNLVNVGIGQGEMAMIPYLQSVAEFESNGLTTSRSSYSADGVLSERYVWEYDKNGQVTSEIYFTEETEPSETITYQRDENGLVMRETKKYLDESVDVTTYQYDDERRLAEKVTVDDEGVTGMREKFVWKDGFLVKHEITDEEGNRVLAEEFVNDARGNVLEHKRVNEEAGENFRIVTKYDDSNRKISEKLYNEDNQLVESTHYIPDKHGRIATSVVTSEQGENTTRHWFDERGYELGQEETDNDGNLIFRVEHSLNENNQLAFTNVFISGNGQRMGQHYELKYEYEWFDDPV